MLFRQYLDKEPVVAVSYLFGCPTKGIGAVVDPIGDVDRYLKESEAGNLPIRFVIETHMHADHISSGRELAEAAAAEYVFFAGTEASYSFRGVQDGEVLDMGNTQAEVSPHARAHARTHFPGRDRSRQRRRAVVRAHRPQRSWWVTWDGPSSRRRPRKGLLPSSRAPHGSVACRTIWR